MNYLDEIFDLPDGSVLNATERSVLPPTLSGRPNYPETRFAYLRRSQLHNVLRAWNLMTPEFEQLDHRKLVERMYALEQAGTFRRKPPEPWYLRQSAYSPDEVQHAKMNGGVFTRKLPGRGSVPFRCAALMPWHGEPPGSGNAADAPATNGHAAQPAAEPSPQKRIKNSAMFALRAEARLLGVNSFGLSQAKLTAAIEQVKRDRGMSDPPAAA